VVNGDRRLRIGLGAGALVIVAVVTIWRIADARGPIAVPDAISTTVTVVTTGPPTIIEETTLTTSAATAVTTVPSTTTTSGGGVFEASVGDVTEDDVFASWRPGCPVAVEDLRSVSVTHWGTDGEPHRGTLIVAAGVVDDIIVIMGDLYEAGFPIEQMEPVDVYDGDDDRSMAANNTSAFNCRAITGGSSWSEHSYGTAIDVNPLLNPYVRGGTALPPEGSRYIDRSLDDPGMIHAGDATVQVFADHGWIWGGTWASPKDYQHFSTTGR
jgi:hypothetical protein